MSTLTKLSKATGVVTTAVVLLGVVTLALNYRNPGKDLCEFVNNDLTMPDNRHCTFILEDNVVEKQVTFMTPQGLESWSYYWDGERYWFNFESARKHNEYK